MDSPAHEGDLETDVSQLREMLQALALKGKDIQQKLSEIIPSSSTSTVTEVKADSQPVEPFLDILLSGDVSELVREMQTFVYKLNSSDYDSNGLNITSLKAIALEAILHRSEFAQDYQYRDKPLKVEAFNSLTTNDDYQPHLTIQFGGELILVIRMFVVSQAHLSGRRVPRIPSKNTSGTKVREGIQSAVSVMKSLSGQEIESMTVTYGKGELSNAKWQTKQDNLTESMSVREVIQVNRVRCMATKVGLSNELGDHKFTILCPLIYCVGPRVFGINDVSVLGSRVK